MAEPWARFDDLRAGESLRFATPHRVVTTTRPEEVAGVLREIEDATNRGRWAFGYVSYEAAAGLDRALPVQPPTPGDPPLVWFGLCGEPARVPPVTAPPGTGEPLPTWRPDWTDAEHAAAVSVVRERIAAGETYQCNLTDRLRSVVTDAPLLYARAAVAQRGAYNAYLELDDHAVVSASPELFVEWIGDTVRTRPMKGTATRGRNTAEDRQQARRLRTSQKEQAENIMIVDLLRNDLGRVAEVGKVHVDELFTLERYPTVWQMTSQVSARVRKDVGLLEIFEALFPCGSVTGAPKMRTMELISELEQAPRGIYCGAIGLVAPPGAPFHARFSVAIRTAVVDRPSGNAVYGAGGGITWDSDPSRERAELRAKAAVLSHEVADHRLVETLAYVPGTGLRNLERHLSRLADSASWFGFRFFREDTRRDLLTAVSARDEGARVRIELSRCGGTTVHLESPPPAAGTPVLLAVDDEPVDESSPWLQHKTTRRSTYVAAAQRHPEADDVVLTNRRGELSETTVANLALRMDGRWWTPPTRSGCLPGVERGRLLDLGVLQERVLRVADLAAAEELAVLSSLRGWRPAELMAGHSGGSALRSAR